MIYRLSVLIAFVLIMSVDYSGAEEKPDAEIDLDPGIYKMTIYRDDYDGEGVKEYHHEKCVPLEKYQPFDGNYKSDRCEVSNFERSENKVSYDIYCNTSLDKGLVGTLSYGFEDETLWWKNYSVGNDGETIFSFKIDGKAVRIGDCDKKETLKPF